MTIDHGHLVNNHWVSLIKRSNVTVTKPRNLLAVNHYNSVTEGRINMEPGGIMEITVVDKPTIAK